MGGDKDAIIEYPVNPWKFGFCSVSVNDYWSDSSSGWGIVRIALASMLISPGNTMWPSMGVDYGKVIFENDKISVQYKAQFTALLFNY